MKKTFMYLFRRAMDAKRMLSKKLSWFKLSFAFFVLAFAVRLADIVSGLGSAALLSIAGMLSILAFLTGWLIWFGERLRQKESRKPRLAEKRQA